MALYQDARDRLAQLRQGVVGGSVSSIVNDEEDEIELARKRLEDFRSGTLERDEEELQAQDKLNVLRGDPTRAEEAFLKTPEGQKILADVEAQRQASEREAYATEELRLSEIQERAQASAESFEEATELEREMFGDAGTTTLRADLVELGYSEEEAAKWEGVDVSALEAHRKLQEEHAELYGMSETTPQMVSEEENIGITEMLKGVWGLFFGKTEVVPPFAGTEVDEDGETVRMSEELPAGTIPAIIADTTFRVAEGLLAVVELTLDEIAIQTGLAGEDDAVQHQRWQLDRMGLGPEELGKENYEANKVVSIYSRFIQRHADLEEERGEEKEVTNGIIATWDVFGKPLIDAWIAADILKVAVRPLVGKFKKVPERGPPGTLGTGKKTKVFTPADDAQVQSGLQIMGFTQKEIANLGKMTEEELAALYAKKLRERSEAIMSGNYKVIEGTIKPAETPDELFKELSKLVDEGEINPAQMNELLRLDVAFKVVTGIQAKNGVVGIPRLMQVAREFAFVVSKPLHSLKQAENALQRAVRLRARQAGEGDITLGMTIDDVSNGMGTKLVSKEVAGKIQPVVEKGESMGAKFTYDSRTNSLIVGSDEMWDGLREAERLALVAAARQAGVNIVRAGELEAGEIPDMDGYYEYILRGFSPGDMKLEDTIKAEQKRLADARKASLSADKTYIEAGLPSDSPIVQAISNSGVSGELLTKTLKEMQQLSTAGGVQDLISKQLLNTRLESQTLQKPIRRSKLDPTNALEKSIMTSQKGITTKLAEIARNTKSAAEFSRKYGFLLDAKSVPSVENRGTGVFSETGTPKERISDLADKGIVTRENIQRVIRAEIPAALVDMSPAGRRELIGKLESKENQLANLTKKGTGADMVASAVFEGGIALDLITKGQFNSPKEVLRLLRASDKKPEVPLFVLTGEGNLALVSKNKELDQTIAAMKMGGVETIPGYIIDSTGALTEFREFMKDNKLTLRGFALQARGLEPKLVAGKTSKKPVPQEMREEAGLLSGKLTRVGTSVENSVIIPSNLLRVPIPENMPMLYSGMLGRDQLFIDKLAMIAEGGSRVVLEFGPNAIIKIAKQELGMVQNLMSYNTHAWKNGLIPNQYMGGSNFIVTEKHKPIDGKALEHFQDFIDAWQKYFSREEIARRKMQTDKLIDDIYRSSDAWLEDAKLENIKGRVTETQLDLSIFEFLNVWRQSDEALLAVTKEGKPLYNWTELSRYNVNLDILKEDSWGMRLDGTMVLVDEGALFREAINLLRDGNKKTWREFHANFEQGVLGSSASKKKFGDSDGHSNFGFTPVPAIDDGEDDNYNDDIWRTLLFSALATVSRGKGKFPRKRKPNKTDVARKAALPKTPAKVPTKVPASTLNSNAFIAKTGEAFGGVFPMPKGTDGKMPIGLPSLDNTEILQPLGKAGYGFLDSNVASLFNKNKKIDYYVSHSNNPLVLNTDKDLELIAKAAGIKDPNIKTISHDVNKDNIAKLRDYIERSMGKDGVLVAMRPDLGKIDLLDRYFEFDQFVNFNMTKADYRLAKGPNVPTVTVTKKVGRSKKLQRQIMRTIDPPASKIVMTEKQALRNRLRVLNTAIKEGTKMGAIEARKSVTARLTNMFEIKQAAALQKTELSKLRQRILDREVQLIQRELVNYMDAMLPAREGAEFVAKKGKMTKAILNTTSRVELQKQLLRVDRMRSDVQKKMLVAEIRKLTDNITSASAVDAEYRGLVREFMKDFDLVRRKASTIKSASKLRDYLDRAILSEAEYEVTKGMVQQMEMLAAKGIESLSVNDLQNILNEIKTLIEFGKAKRRTLLDLRKLRAQNAFAQIKGNVVGLSSKDLDTVPTNIVESGNILSKQQKFNNWWKSKFNMGLESSAALRPMDYFFATLEGETIPGVFGEFDGPLSRIFRDVYSERYSYGFLDKYDAFQDDLNKLLDRINLSDKQMGRVGLYLHQRRGESTDVLVAMGYKRSALKEIADTITPKEMELANFIDDFLEYHRPKLARVAKDVYNKEFEVLEQMFPMLTDFQKVADSDYLVQDMFGTSAPTHGDRKVVKEGTTHKRKTTKGRVGKTDREQSVIDEELMREGAEAKLRPIQVNAVQVILKHAEHVFYMEEMAETVRFLGDVVAQPGFRAEVGDIGTELTKSYVDVLARMGGARNQEVIPFFSAMRRNLTPAVLAGKLSVVLIQPTAIGVTASVLGSGPTMIGVRDITFSKAMRRYTYVHSPEVRSRAGGDYSFLENATTEWLQTYNKNAFFGVRYLDSLTASAGWMAAYKAALKKRGIAFNVGEFNKEAGMWADKIVRTTQASSAWKDAPLALTSGRGITGNREVNKAIFSFQSFPLVLWNFVKKNIISSLIKGTAKEKLRGMKVLLYFIITSMAVVAQRRVSNMTENFIVGRDNEDDRRLAERSFTQDVLREMYSLPPYVSPAVSVAVYESSPVPMLNASSRALYGGYRAYEGMVAGNDTAVAKGLIDVTAGLGSLGGVGGTMELATLMRAWVEAQEGSASGTGDSAERPERDERPTRPARPSR